MSNLLTIINAKLSDKSDLGDWYKERLKACLPCEYNSENKEHHTFREKGMVLANLGKTTCLACGCEIAAKASVETEDCGATKVGKESKWMKLDISKVGDLIVTNSTTHVASLTKKSNGSYLLDYGIKSLGQYSQIDLKISKKGMKVSKISYKSSCGCTIPEASFDEKSQISLKITYDTKRLGLIDKNVTISIIDDKKRLTKLFFNIKGEVKK